MPHVSRRSKLRALVATALFLAAWSVWQLATNTEDVWLPEWDSALYLLTGEALAEGRGYVYLERPFFLRPPGFAFLVAPFAKGGLANAWALNVFVLGQATASLAALAFAVRRVHGGRIAFATTVVCALSPLFVRNLNQVLSDFPFLALLFLAIGLFETRATGRRRVLEHLGGALALTAALYLRTAAVLLLPWLVLRALFQRDGADGPRRGPILRAVLAVVFVLALSLPWILQARSRASEAERPSEQLLLFDYSTAVFHIDPGDPASATIGPAALAERAARSGRRLSFDLARDVLQLPPEAPVHGWVPTVALLLVGALVSLHRRASLLDAWGLIYLLVIVTYFVYTPRLALPLVPIAALDLVLAVDAGLGFLAQRFERPRLVPVGLGLVVALLAAVGLARAPSADRARAESFAALGAWVRERVPPGARLLCDRAPIFSVLTDRTAFTYRYPRGADLVHKHAIDYVLFDTPVPDALLRSIAEAARETWIYTDPDDGKRTPLYRLR